MFLTKFNYIQVAPYYWRVLSTLEYLWGNTLISVPVGFTTDFASTPRWVRKYFRQHDKYSPAAVVHDYVYRTHVLSKPNADRMFYDAMLDLNVPKAKAFIMYQAVKFFGAKHYGDARRAIKG